MKQNSAPLLPTPANLKYAARVAAEIQQRIALDAFNMADFFPEDEAPTTGTVAQTISQWLGTLRVTPSTMHGYRNALGFWTRALVNQETAKLKPSQVKAALAARQDLSGKTLNNYLSVLRQALSMAVADGTLARNPAEGIPTLAHQKKGADPFTREEVEAIIGYMAQYHPGTVHNLTEFWFWTGMRTGEIAALKWKHIDHQGKRAMVQESIVGGLERDSTKTHTARWVHLNSRALAALERQPKGTALIFGDPHSGAPWLHDKKYRRKYWTPALKALGIRYRRPYCMRHTYATSMLMAGMTPAFCARQLGHSVEMFLGTYTRWLDGSQDAREMSLLERNLAPSWPQPAETPHKSWPVRRESNP